MAIAVRGFGALQTTTTNSLTFVLPTGGSAPQAGDLIILHFGAGQDNPQPAYSSGLSGYTQRGSTVFLDYGPGGITQWIYWKIAGASESNPSVTINDGSDGLWGYAIVFSGVDNASPFDLASVSQGTNTSASTYTPPNVSTQTANAWVVSFIQTSDNNVLGLLSGSEQGFTLDVGGASYGTDIGLDASFGVAHKLIASPTSVTLPTWEQTAVGPDYWAYQTIGLTLSSAGTKTGNFTANATFKKNSGTKTFTADATRKANSGTKTFTADAWVQPFFLVNAIVKATVSAGTTFTSDAIRRANSGTLTFSAAATILKTWATGAQTFLVDAVRKDTIATGTTFTADAIRVDTIPVADKTIDAIVLATVSAGKTFTADSVVQGAVAAPVWTTPISGVGVSSTPTFAFTMPDPPNATMFFHMQLDTADTFDTGDLREYKSNFVQTGWEYWDGGDWQAVPATGVPDTYAGNEARYTIQAGDELTTGTWYRRVRAG